MSIKKAKVTISEVALTWEFANGVKVVVDPESFSFDIQRAAMFHGLKQKLSDCYAGATTPTEAQHALESVLQSLQAGSWNAGRSSSGGVIVEALAIVAKVSLEEALEKWNEMSEEQKKGVKAHKGVKLEVARINMERAERAADGEEELVI